MTRSSLASGNGSQSAYVAVMIENDILSGRLAPNTPLKSIRELAKVYNVTRTVISCALDILERKNLITRISRKGLFVKGKSAGEGMTDVLFFAMDREPAKSAFVAQMLQLINSPHTHGKFNFTIRLASSQSEENIGHLEEELFRMEKFGYPDCAIIIPINFTRKEVEQCLKLPYPVVFLGDFNDGDHEGLNYYRITPSCHREKSIVQYAKERGYTSLTNIVAEMTLNAKFEISSNELLKKEARRAGLRFSTLMIPGKNYPEAVRILPFVLEKNRKEICSSDLLFTDWLPFPKMDFNLPEHINGVRLPDSETPWLQIDYEPLFERLLCIVDHVKKNPGGRKIEVVELSRVTLESRTGHSLSGSDSVKIEAGE